MIGWNVLFRLVLAAFCLSGCSPSASRREVGPADPTIRYTGWFDRRDPKAVRFAWPGSQVEIGFAGTGLEVRLTDTPAKRGTKETDWLTVVIDDKPPTTIALTRGTRVYELAKGLTPGSHRALLWKRTEAEVGVVTLHGFAVQGATGAAVTVPPRKQRRLVFIGDSITAGYGNEGAGPSCHGSADTENNFDTYGAYAARELAAEYVAAAWSGKGLTRNYDPRDALTIPKIWTRVIPTEDDSPDIGTGKADVVILNLGTNDFLQGVPEEREFVTAFRKLLAEVRARFPGTSIVLALGPMLADDYPQPMARSLARRWLAKIQQEEQAATDVRISSIEFWFAAAEGVGCGFHPNKKTHARMGRELAAHLRAQLGW